MNADAAVTISVYAFDISSIAGRPGRAGWSPLRARARPGPPASLHGADTAPDIACQGGWADRSGRPSPAGAAADADQACSALIRPARHAKSCRALSRLLAARTVERPLANH